MILLYLQSVELARDVIMVMPVLSIPDVYDQSSVIRVFIHAVTSVGDVSVVNLNDKGAARAILLARQQDVIIVASSVEQAYLDYFKESGFAVDPARILVVAVDSSSSLINALLNDYDKVNQLIKLIGGHNVILDSFALSELEIILVDKLKSLLAGTVNFVGADLAIAQAVNRKDIARQLAIDVNVPVAPADLIHDVLGVNVGGFKKEVLLTAINRQMKMTGGVVVKGAVGASGSSTFVVNKTDCVDELLQQLSKRQDNDVYLVEPLFKLNTAPNVTVWIDPGNGDVALVNSTDQRLNNSLVFSGSVYPSSAVLHNDIVVASERFAKYLYQKGVSGWVGFDFVEYYDELAGAYKFFFSEINARYNAGLYAKTVFDVVRQQQQRKQLPVPSVYMTENLMLSPMSFLELQSMYQDLFFNPQTGVGVMPFNPGRFEDGLIALICMASSVETATQLISSLHEHSMV
jgi:hypothetical protein